MEVEKAALEYLVETGKKLTEVKTFEIDGRTYTRNEIKPVSDPAISALSISTLSSLIDLCTGKFADGEAFEQFDPKKHVVHVCSPTQVKVITAKSNRWKDRQVLIDCSLTETASFPLGQFLGQDKLIIALLSCCAGELDRDYLTKLVGNVTAEKVTTAQDDGVSQQVGTRDGAHLETQKTVKNIVNLRMWRTFREVQQPKSQFLVRLRQSGENIPEFALFEADGGAWKLEAIENVARYLRAGLKEAVVAS